MERKFDVKAYATSKAQIEKMTFYQNDTGASSILFEVNQDPQNAMDGIVSSSVTLQNPDETDNKTFGMEYITITGNVIDFTLPNWALSEEGTYNGQIMVYGSDSKRLTMTNFKYKVNSQIPNGINNDDSDIPILTELINSTNEVMNRHEDNYEEALALSSTNANLEIVDARKGETNLGVKIGLIDSSLEEMTKKEIIIDAHYPPLGLLPLTGADATQDTIRLQAIFDFIKANETSYSPDGGQQTGVSYSVRLRDMTYVFNAQITLKGQYLNIIANRAIIKMTDSSLTALYANGSNCRKLYMKGLTFEGMATAINIDKDNIDCGLIDFNRCWFFTTTSTALKIKDQSSMVTFNKCHFFHCRYIVETIICDRVLFNDCWISDAPRQTNQETSFIFNSAEVKFHNCFLIPNGYNTSTGEESLTEIAWIKCVGGSIDVEHCRISSEDNSRTLINFYNDGSTSSPYVPRFVRVSNNTKVSAQHGECIVRLFGMPNKIEINNNGFVRANDVPIKYGTEFDATVWQNSSITAINSKIEIVIQDNLGQNSNANLCPVELKRFLRINSVEQGLLKKDVLVTSLRDGNFTGVAPYFDIVTGIATTGASELVNKVYMVKMIIRPSNGNANYRSVFVGLLGFIIGRYDGVTKAKAVLTPLFSSQGGTETNQASPLIVTPTFIDSGTDTISIVSGATTKYNVRLTWGGIVDTAATGYYTIKEVMDGCFLF